LSKFLDSAAVDLPRVDVIVPAFNEESYIGACLESLLQQDYPRHLYHIVVVDNGSKDNTMKIARSFDVDVRENREGRVGAVRNFGVSISSGKIIAFIDADCVAPVHWISEGVKMVGAAGVGAVGGIYLLRENPSWIERGWVLNTPIERSEVTTLVGGSMFIPRDLFNRVGGFDETINAGEDTKLSHEIRKLGFKLLMFRQLAVVHLGYPSTALGFMSRQFWHASSFFRSKNGWLDRTFLLTLMYSLSIVIVPVLLAFGQFRVAIPILVAIILGVLAFTIRRILFAKAFGSGVIRLVSAAIIDHLYFLARSAGMWVCLIWDPFKK
jgi:glycosyltransferase involved in cell wall biosynthesis